MPLQYVFFFQFTWCEPLDVVKFHECLHGMEAGSHGREIKFSADQIAEGPTTTQMLLMICVQFIGCKNVYPVAVFRRNSQYKYNDRHTPLHVPNPQSVYRRVLEMLCAEGFVIVLAPADLPVRADMRNCVHAAGIINL